jgi:hypothetical protein
MRDDVSAPLSDIEDRVPHGLAGPWQLGTLFHVFSRYPRRPEAVRIDRLASVLRHGLIPPALDPQGRVISDLRLQVTGCSRPYDSIVFLHEFGGDSALYLPRTPDTICCFVDRSVPIIRPQPLQPNWVVLCRDEVYVDRVISPQQLIGIAVAPQVAKAVCEELEPEFRRLALPLYDFSGRVQWLPK